MISEFGFHGSFENSFGELFEQAMFTENIIGLFVVFQ
jgi:hypothetical protein